MSGVVLKKCDCKGTPPNASDYQDKKYGSGIRVLCVSFKGEKGTCTVCGRVHNLK